jgi:hypothetical protein
MEWKKIQPGTNPTDLFVFSRGQGEKGMRANHNHLRQVSDLHEGWQSSTFTDISI